MHNPELDKAIEEIVFNSPVSEFELIRSLQSAEYQLLNAEALENNLTMFQAHFLVQNSLYRLRQTGIDSKKFILDILPTKITPLPFTDYEPAVAKFDKLAAYYLDWTNFSHTTEQQVDELISDFWKKMAGEVVTEKEIEEALEKLNLAKMPSKRGLKKQYKALMLEHHPDRGGRSQRAIEIKQAYELLLCC